MNINVNISQLKRQLNIEPEFTGDDTILQQFLDVAKSATIRYLGSSVFDDFTEDTIPDEVIQSILLLAANFYINRNMVTFAQGVELPYSYKFLLGPIKNYSIN
jgi:hypothetical protein